MEHTNTLSISFATFVTKILRITCQKRFILLQKHVARTRQTGTEVASEHTHVAIDSLCGLHSLFVVLSGELKVL